MRIALLLIIFLSECLDRQLLAQPNLSKDRLNLPAVKAYSNNPDSIKLPAFDSNNTGTRYKLEYTKIGDLIKFFSPYYDKSICEPGNLNHIKYTNYTKKSTQLLNESKQKCIDYLKTSNQWKNMLLSAPDDISKLQDYTFSIFYIYHLTYNVVSYNNENARDFRKFFNLDTTYHYFKITDKNNLVYIYRYKNGKIYGTRSLSDQDSINYAHILQLKKEPIGIQWDLSQDYGNFDKLGFIDSNTLMFSLCKQGYYYDVKENGEKSKEPTLKRECKVSSAKAYYINEDNVLLQKIVSAYENLVGSRKAKPLGNIDVRFDSVRSE